MPDGARQPEKWRARGTLPATAGPIHVDWLDAFCLLRIVDTRIRLLVIDSLFGDLNLVLSCLHAINSRGVLNDHPCLVTEHDCAEESEDDAQQHHNCGHNRQLSVKDFATRVLLAVVSGDPNSYQGPTRRDHGVKVE